MTRLSNNERTKNRPVAAMKAVAKPVRRGDTIQDIDAAINFALQAKLDEIPGFAEHILNAIKNKTYDKPNSLGYALPFRLIHGRFYNEFVFLFGQLDKDKRRKLAGISGPSDIKLKRFAEQRGAGDFVKIIDAVLESDTESKSKPAPAPRVSQ